MDYVSYIYQRRVTMHRLKVELFEQNRAVMTDSPYRCNLHFGNRQEIQRSPVARKMILEGKTTLRGTEEIQNCIRLYDAFMDLPNV